MTSTRLFGLVRVHCNQGPTATVGGGRDACLQILQHGTSYIVEGSLIFIIIEGALISGDGFIRRRPCTLWVWPLIDPVMTPAPTIKIIPSIQLFNLTLEFALKKGILVILGVPPISGFLGSPLDRDWMRAYYIAHITVVFISKSFYLKTLESN